jgi:hypothetical protein
MFDEEVPDHGKKRISKVWVDWLLSVPVLDKSGNFQIQRADANSGYVYTAPVTGFNSTIQNATSQYIMNPTGTLATGTLIMPSAPIDGQELTIACTQAITSLTMSANTGQTLKGALTTIAANGFAQWRYIAIPALWIRVG